MQITFSKAIVPLNAFYVQTQHLSYIYIYIYNHTLAEFQDENSLSFTFVVLTVRNALNFFLPLFLKKELIRKDAAMHLFLF